MGCYIFRNFENLLSISKLTQALKCNVTFYHNFCVVQYMSMKKMIGLGKQHNGLYYLTTNQNPHLTHSVDYISKLWHQRLGHPSTAPLQALSKTVREVIFNFQHVCDICPLAKQTHLPFSHSSISSNAPFDLILCDIWGPHKFQSHFGARYFLTIVDDFSRFTWIHLMSFKSKTQSLLKSFFSWAKTQFHCDVKVILTDNGSEFIYMRFFFCILMAPVFNILALIHLNKMGL